MVLFNFTLFIYFVIEVQLCFYYQMGFFVGRFLLEGVQLFHLYRVLHYKNQNKFSLWLTVKVGCGVWIMVFKASFNNISVISLGLIRKLIELQSQYCISPCSHDINKQVHYGVRYMKYFARKDMDVNEHERLSNLHCAFITILHFTVTVGSSTMRIAV